MSKVDAMEFKAGRELDALVAEQVMGLHVITSWYTYDPETKQYWCDPMQRTAVRPYSTSIAAAWEVVENIVARESTLIFVLRCFSNHWHCAFGPTSYEADTAPLAICRAALKAVGA